MTEHTTPSQAEGEPEEPEEVDTREASGDAVPEPQTTPSQAEGERDDADEDAGAGGGSGS
ncbi:hypothetical protein [Streptomyces sp. NPDC088812]|uniref:hypothetical protein n=1 Tax=Streptomyces sp. NPDC088812 TaxID=3365905 RepID=UPI0037FD89DF